METKAGSKSLTGREERPGSGNQDRLPLRERRGDTPVEGHQGPGHVNNGPKDKEISAAVGRVAFFPPSLPFGAKGVKLYVFDFADDPPWKDSSLKSLRRLGVLASKPGICQGS